MKKLYHTPFLECVELCAADVLTLSEGIDLGTLFGELNFIRKLRAGADSDGTFGEVETIRKRQ